MYDIKGEQEWEKEATNLTQLRYIWNVTRKN